ncbi:MAG: bifunctional diaminohydroxyphosphoribosylaminopyrimidine deaminase/5-amino-6-(5-phosphoribosylamino)uracil reductase RibD [Microbacteriaceae bacterium]
MHEPHAIENAMRRALALAARGPATGANPQVGCVILSAAGEIIAEGWHRGAGTAHAEIDALAQLTDARGMTVVVSLEPCNHTGRTGPCSEALIEAGVAEVVYAVPDPDPVAGGGAARLRAAGVRVTAGVLVDEVAEAMRVWLTATRLSRPFVTVKWASSLDGRAAADDGSSQWITGPEARRHVHEQRARVDAVIVGTGTVFADDPSLTARDEAGELLPEQPIPVVIGLRQVPGSAILFSHPRPAIVTGSRDLSAILRSLFDGGIRHVFVEGGPTLASAFVTAGLVDDYLIYLAPTLLGGDRLVLGDIGVKHLGEARRLHINDIERLGDDLLVRARPTSEAAQAEAQTEGR